MTRLANARLILPDRVAPGALVLDGGQIAAVETGANAAARAGDRDLAGGYLAPGFIDLHVHGGDGADFLDAAPDAFARVLAFHARRGVTGLLATAAAAAPERLGAFLAAARDARDRPPPGARLLGVHLEGPWLNPARRGCQDERKLRPIDLAEAERLLGGDDLVRQVTFAPELPGGLELARLLAGRGVVAAAGHSDSYGPLLARARAAGVGHATHLFSGMSQWKREGPARVPGLVETVLGSNDWTAEMIADGRHLPPEMMRYAWRALGSDRLCLVSDATRGAGRPEGESIVFGPVEDGVAAVIENGVAVLPDRSAFAGSVTPLDRMLRLAVNEIGVPLAEAVRLVSWTPARIAGFQDRRGRLAAGLAADLVLLDDDLEVRSVWIAGRAQAGP